MKSFFRGTARTFLGCMAAALAVSACADDTIVYRDGEPFNPPPDSIVGFLGYFDQAASLTTCGNCHAEPQEAWENSGHAEAHATLAASPAAQDFCYECHTVGEQGNLLTEPAGFAVTGDSAYFDVQCENCHGPGRDHPSAPEAGQPRPSIAVSDSNGCGECHTGTHHPFAEQWAQSPHAQPVPYVISRAAGDPDDECLACHAGQGVLARWEVAGTYIEADDPVDDWVGITCAVCHDPHGSPNTKQLRYPIDVPDPQANLCMQCHNRRAEPDTESATLRGPHAPEGPLLLGEGAGWIPPGSVLQTERIRGSHGDIGNRRTCATCHVAMYDVTDAATGDFVIRATGHLFLAIPCTDASGVPTDDQTCTVDQREFAGCSAAGCHSTEARAQNAYIAATARIGALVAEIDSLLTVVPAGQRNSSDGVFTVADGAWFNARLAELPGSPIHNPFFIERLLVASIDALSVEYNLVAPFTRVSLEYEL